MTPLVKLLAIKKLIQDWAVDENYDHDSAYLSQIEDIVNDCEEVVKEIEQE